jgi:hypothetical protein
MPVDNFWYNNPNILFRSDSWYVFVPKPNMPVSDALNAVVRFSIYLSVLLTMTTMNPWYILIIPVVMGVSVLLHQWFPKAKKITEPFASGPVVTGYVGTETTRPTDDNPFMNPQLTDILDNPERPPAAEVTRKDIRDEVNDAFSKTSNIYMDTTDVFDMVQAQRNFHTVPADDHKGFLDFLGKNGQATNQKLLSEGYVIAKGTIEEPLTTDISAPVGTSPSSANKL